MDKEKKKKQDTVLELDDTTKERNKRFLFMFLGGLVLFEMTRQYVGTAITLLIFFLGILWIFRTNAPDKWNSYCELLGLEKLKTPKNLNKIKNNNKVETYK